MTSNTLAQLATCASAGLPYTILCDGRVNIAATGATTGGVTPGALTGLRCGASVAGCAPSSVGLSGSVVVSFNNATSELTLSSSGQNLTVASTCSLVPSGRANISSSSSTVADVVFGVSPATTVTAGP